MGSDLFTQLRWLPRAPGDFEARLRALDPYGATSGGGLQSLASHALDDNRLAKVARLIATARAAGSEAWDCGRLQPAPRPMRRC